MAIEPDHDERGPDARSLVCVLGMHRSGTSVAAQLLCRLGAGLGPQVLAAMDGVNEEGFWEDSRVVELDEQLLAAYGRRWQDGEPLAVAEPQTLDDIGRAACEHFAAHYVGAGPWVVKDPRQCRLLPFWLQVWRETGFEVCPVYMLRHPFAVAKSLQRRDRIPVEYSVLLWLVYTLEGFAWEGGRYAATVVSHSDGQLGIVGGAARGVTMTYEAFCEQPLALPRVLRERCGLRLPLAEAQWEAAAASVVRQHLRHQNGDLSAGAGMRELLAFAASTYETLAALAPALPTPALLVALNAELEVLLQRYGDELAMLQRLTGELMSFSAETVRIGTLHSVALHVIQERDGTAQERDAVIQEKDKVIQEKVAILQEKDKVIQEKDAVLREKDKVLQEKDTVLQEKNKVLQDKDTVLQKKDEVLQEKDRVIQEKDGAIQYRESVIREKDKMLAERNQLIKDIAYLRFWRVLPHLMRRMGKR